MPKKRPPWYVRRDPAAIHYAFFIFHVGEDADAVGELKTAVDAYSGRGGRPPLTCFLDVQNWPGGNVSSEVIREYLYQSAHMIAWISPAYLVNTRGWIWMELAYAELIELSNNFDYLGVRKPFIVPVFHNVTVDLIQRTRWVDYWSRQVVIPNQQHSVTDIAHKLVDFHEQEERKREDVGT
jgi:hypothetical protein